MSNTNKLVIVIALILIVICVVVGNRKNSNINTNLSTENTIIESAYNEVIDEITGEKKYVVYDKNTGEEIVILDEEQSHLLPIYQMDPTYEEIPVEPQEEQIDESNITE